MEKSATSALSMFHFSLPYLAPLIPLLTISSYHLSKCYLETSFFNLSFIISKPQPETLNFPFLFPVHQLHENPTCKNPPHPT